MRAVPRGENNDDEARWPCCVDAVQPGQAHAQAWPTGHWDWAALGADGERLNLSRRASHGSRAQTGDGCGRPGAGWAPPRGAAVCANQRRCDPGPLEPDGRQPRSPELRHPGFLPSAVTACRRVCCMFTPREAVALYKPYFRKAPGSVAVGGRSLAAGTVAGTTLACSWFACRVWADHPSEGIYSMF